jgi:hypothetical protein
MEKAKKLPAERNLDPSTVGMDADDFSILDARSDSQLGSVIMDSSFPSFHRRGPPWKPSLFFE